MSAQRKIIMIYTRELWF